MSLYHILKCFIIFFCVEILLHFKLYSIPDVTIVGYIKPDDGLGKIPINIVETLGSEISSNFLATPTQNNLWFDVNALPPSMNACLNNPDTETGKVGLLTEGLWSIYGTPASSMQDKFFIKLAYSMLENTAIPTKWVEILNNEFDAVIVPDKYLVSVYQNSGVQIPIFVLPIPMNLKPFFQQTPHGSSPGKPFVFVDASANKNPRILIKAFAKAFGNKQNVRLVMRAVTLQNLNLLMKDIKKHRLSNIVLQNGSLSLQQYIEDLSSYDCYINLSRGEGFSFIPREALSLGLPVIITNNTSSTTICETGFVSAIPSDIKGPSNSIYKILFDDECGQQFDCRVEDVVEALKDMYYNYPKHIKKARTGRKWVAQYDCSNSKLRLSYQTLIKPKQVKFGEENIIQDGTLITNSQELYEKYKMLENWP